MENDKVTFTKIELDDNKKSVLVDGGDKELLMLVIEASIGIVLDKMSDLEKIGFIIMLSEQIKNLNSGQIIKGEEKVFDFIEKNKERKH